MVIAETDFRPVIAELITPNLSVDIISEAEYNTIEPPLDWYRALVYALYTPDRQPVEITSAKPPNHTTALYVIAYSPEISAIMTPGNNSSLQTLVPEFYHYKDVAGLFRLEYGTTSNDALPIEAMELLNYPAWPHDTQIGYFSQFSPNPLLPQTIRLQVLKQLYARASEITHAENFAEYSYVILADHVLKFVQEAGISAIHQPGATLNWESAAARQIFETFPGYWQNNPQLYKFIPF